MLGRWELRQRQSVLSHVVGGHQAVAAGAGKHRQAVAADLLRHREILDRLHEIGEGIDADDAEAVEERIVELVAAGK